MEQSIKEQANTQTPKRGDSLHTNEAKKSLITESLRYSMVLDYVLFPVDVIELASILEREGYRMPRPFPEASSSARIGYGGTIGLKSDHSIHMDTDRQIIGIEAKSTEMLLGSFQTLLNEIIQREMGIDVSRKVKYSELIARFSITTGRSPISEIQKAFEGNVVLSHFGSILNEEVSLFNFRIVPKGVLPEATNWFEITVEPVILKSRTTYSIGAIYRRKNKSEVDDFIRGLDTTILRLIDAFESR